MMLVFSCTVLLVCFCSSGFGSISRYSSQHQPIVVNVPKEWPRKANFLEKPSRRKARATAGVIPHEFDLQKDTHRRGIVHWSGNNSNAVFFVTQDAQQSTVTHSTFWRSLDYGKTFLKEDAKFDSDAVINSFYPCPNNKSKLIFTDLKKPHIYVTEDEGRSFVGVDVRFKATDILFHPTHQDWVIALDRTTNQAYVSIDLCTSWRQLAPNITHATIHRMFWGVPVIDKPSLLFFELSVDSVSAVVYQDDALVKDGSSLQLFHGSVYGFQVNSLEVVDEYMFVEVQTTQYMDMYRSYKRGAFQKAYFATNHPFRDFFVVDATEHQMFIAVYHYDNLTSLYTSDITGRFFTLSLDNIVSAPSVFWSQSNSPFVDFYRVRGILGIYIANQFLATRRVQTMISFNKGGDWQRLQASKNVTCPTKPCYVNLHMSYGSQLYGLTDIFTSENGIGLIMAHGNVGDYLRREATMMVSRNAGLNWDKALKESSQASGFDFLFGDHGSYMAATDHYKQSTYLHYSCKEGTDATWPSVKFSQSNDLVVNGMFTEPGETTEIATVFCSRLNAQGYLQNWVIIQLNFTSLFAGKCHQSDYRNWTPLQEADNTRCLLGQRTTYQRRRTDHCCYNGREYTPPLSTFTCHCTREDYECDYGYTETPSTSQCTRMTGITPYDSTNDCQRGSTYNMTVGYRKVAGDVCSGGDTSQWTPRQKVCSVTVATHLELESDIEGSGVAVGQAIVFTLLQQSGSSYSTRYLWLFGDGSKNETVKGSAIPIQKNHTYTKAGTFTVFVRAFNDAGSSYVTLSVSVYDVISNITVIPPHAVLPNSNVSFICQATDIAHRNTPPQPPPQLGPLHYEWKFEDDLPFMLTRNNTMYHVFQSTGRFRVSVAAYNPVSIKTTHVYIPVFRAVHTLRLGFTSSADMAKANDPNFNQLFPGALIQAVAKVTQTDASRFEAFLLSSATPVKADLSVVARTEEEESGIRQIVDEVEASVNSHTITIGLSQGRYQIRATSAQEVQVNYQLSSSTSSKSVSGPTVGIIIVSIFAVIIIIACVAIGLWYRRRYYRLEYAYSRLNRDNGVRLTLGSEDSDDESPLATAGLHRVQSGKDDDDDGDDDDKLLDDV